MSPYLHVQDFIELDELATNDLVAALRTDHIESRKRGGSWCSRSLCCLTSVRRLMSAESGSGAEPLTGLRLVGWADAKAVKAEGMEVEREAEGKWMRLLPTERLAAGDLLKANAGASLAIAPTGATNGTKQVLETHTPGAGSRFYLVVGVMADPPAGGHDTRPAGTGRLSK